MILYNDTFLPPEEVSISYLDRGYYFGDGVYEVIRIYNGEIFEMQAHLDRLARSAESIRLTIPYSIPELSHKIEQLVDQHTLKDAIVYLQITRGAATRSHVFPEQVKPTLLAYCREMERPLEKMKHGVEAITRDDIRWLRCDIKSLNLLPNTMAKQEAADNRAEEVIFHRDGTVTEGSSSNIMMIKDQALYTHPANHLILNGITRELLLKLAKKIHIATFERPFTLKELEAADEVVMTSTTSEVIPIIRINEKDVGQGIPGPLTRKLQAAFEQAI